MKHTIPTVAFLAAMSAAGPAPAAETAPVRVFDAGELAPHRYTVLKRLWTDTWRASFWIPRHADAGEAVAAITREAASLGSDGVVNLHCLSDGGGYFCYGLAIKLK